MQSFPCGFLQSLATWWYLQVEVSSISVILTIKHARRNSFYPYSSSLDLPTRCSKSQSSSLVCCSEIWGLVYRSCGCPIPQVLPTDPVGGDDPVLLGIQSLCVPSRRSGNKQGLLGHVGSHVDLVGPSFPLPLSLPLPRGVPFIRCAGGVPSNCGLLL